MQFNHNFFLFKINLKQNSSVRPGARLARALYEAGPSFVKFGQALSTQSNILNDTIAYDLSNLQDQLPPFSSEQAKLSIETEMRKNIDEVFLSFDETAVAAASIAQVHFAVTVEGREVAVKILRPNIEEAFRKDLNLFGWLTKIAENSKSQFKRLKLPEILLNIEKTVQIEMDLRLEAAAAAELAENFSGDPTFSVPKIDWSRTSRRMMTTDRLNGIPIDNRQAIISAGLDPKKVLRHATEVCFKQVFRDGFFHADIHPGNMFVLDSGIIGVVDFGIMGRLDLKTRRYIGEILFAFLNRNYDLAANLHFKAGWVSSQQSISAFAQACRGIAEPILDKPQNEISIAHLLAQLFQVSEIFKMEAQPQLLLQKTMIMAEGITRKLCPEANIWLLARPLMEDWMWTNSGPEAHVRDTVNNVSHVVERLPEFLNSIEESSSIVSEGRVKLHPETMKTLRQNTTNHRPFSVASAIFFLLILGYLTLQ